MILIHCIASLRNIGKSNKWRIILLIIVLLFISRMQNALDFRNCFGFCRSCLSFMTGRMENSTFELQKMTYIIWKPSKHFQPYQYHLKLSWTSPSVILGRFSYSYTKMVEVSSRNLVKDGFAREQRYGPTLLYVAYLTGRLVGLEEKHVHGLLVGLWFHRCFCIYKIPLCFEEKGMKFLSRYFCFIFAPLQTASVSWFHAPPVTLLQRHRNANTSKYFMILVR